MVPVQLLERLFLSFAKKVSIYFANKSTTADWPQWKPDERQLFESSNIVDVAKCLNKAVG